MLTPRILKRAAVSAIALLLTPALATPVPASADHAGPQPGPVNAANTYGWYPLRWKYDWEQGQNFAPWRRWSDGTGVAYIKWAMLVLDSSVDNYNQPSRGSVSATLNRRGSRYGRWELRLRAPMWYGEGANYTVRVELVPRRKAARRCGARNIGLASFTPGSSQVTVYARNAPNREWRFTKTGIRLDRASWHTYAVEVKPRRISWFIDGHVVSTLRNRRAVSDVVLTPRLTLEGTPGAAMDRVRAGVDWVRHFSLRKKNKHPLRSPAPVRTTYNGAC